jgi:hypothetical protein
MSPRCEAEESVIVPVIDESRAAPSDDIPSDDIPSDDIPSPAMRGSVAPGVAACNTVVPSALLTGWTGKLMGKTCPASADATVKMLSSNNALPLAPSCCDSRRNCGEACRAPITDAADALEVFELSLTSSI